MVDGSLYYNLYIVAGCWESPCSSEKSHGYMHETTNIFIRKKVSAEWFSPKGTFFYWHHIFVLVLYKKQMKKVEIIRKTIRDNSKNSRVIKN